MRFTGLTLRIALRAPKFCVSLQFRRAFSVLGGARGVFSDEMSRRVSVTLRSSVSSASAIFSLPPLREGSI